VAGENFVFLIWGNGQSALLMGWRVDRLEGVSVKIREKIERKGIRGQNL
jgi:hypothetical protein